MQIQYGTTSCNNQTVAFNHKNVIVAKLWFTLQLNWNCYKCQTELARFVWCGKNETNVMIHCETYVENKGLRLKANKCSVSARA